MNAHTFTRAVFRICKRESLMPVLCETFALSERSAREVYDSVALEFAETPRPVHDATAGAMQSERLAFLRENR